MMILYEGDPYLEASASVRTTVYLHHLSLWFLKVKSVTHHYHLSHFLGCASWLYFCWVLREFLEVACV